MTLTDEVELVIVFHLADCFPLDLTIVGVRREEDRRL